MCNNVIDLLFIGNPPLSAEASVRVRVIDKSMPVFDRQFYSATIAEDLSLGSPILSIRAESPKSRTLIYSVTQGNEFEEFGVDFSTGKFI